MGVRTSTGFADMEGNMIYFGNEVECEGLLFEVTINDFTGKTVIDGESGQADLVNIHHYCKVTRDVY